MNRGRVTSTSQISEVAKIVVLDPGLEAQSGHHFALLEATLNTSPKSLGDAEIKFYAHQNLPERCIDPLSKSRSLSVVQHFQTHLYEFYRKRPTFSDANSYIVRLSWEYRTAIQKELKIASADQVLVFLYPAVKWEHMAALNSAITELEASGLDLEYMMHKICLMYNPGVDYEGAVYDLREYAGYKIASKPLSERKNIDLYVSDYELSMQFAELLGKEALIHPCYLHEFPEEPAGESGKDNRQTARRIGLYHGDAKHEKGFLKVADALEVILPQLNDDDQVHIHFTLNAEDSKLVSVATRILEIGQFDRRVVINRGFLSGAQLMSEIEKLTEYIFLYDSNHYQNKSSGIAWLIAFFKCPSTTIGSSWISRELSRLGVRVSVIESTRSIDLDSGSQTSYEEATAQNLRSQIYGDFWQDVLR